MECVIEKKTKKKNTQATTKMLMTNRMLCDTCVLKSMQNKELQCCITLLFQENEQEMIPNCQRFHVHTTVQFDKESVKRK